MENIPLTSQLINIKLGDLFKNCVNSLIETLEELTTLWSHKKDVTVENLDFSSKIYSILVKIINTLTINNRGFYLGILLIFFSFILFNLNILWQST